MHLFHRWRDVQPDGKKPPPGVHYQQCTRDGCDARRVLDTLRGGYRGGGAMEAEWVRTGVMPALPPPRGPRGSGGIPTPPKRIEVHVYHHHESEGP